MSPAPAAAPRRDLATALEQGPALYSLIAIGLITESLTNPRKRFDEASLKELALSIQEQGVIEPLIVRPMKGDIEAYELVAGARRLRAAKIAQLADVPCIVRDLTDRQALELQITENLQRKDIHPLEEADGYAALQKADKAYTIEALAQRVGRTAAYIKSRLKFLTLTAEVRKAFEDDRITAAHAAVLTKVPAKLQKEGLAACFYKLFSDAEVGDDGNRIALQSVRELESWYRYTVAVDVKAPETQEQFPELLEAAKEAPGGVLVPIVHSYYLDGTQSKLKPTPLTSREWKEVKGKATCAHVKTGVVVLGKGRAETVQICTTTTCATHWPERQPQKATKTTKGATSTPALSKWEKDRRDREAKERKLANALARVRPQACQQLLAKFQGKQLTDDVVEWLIDKVTPTALHATIESALGPKKTWTTARATSLILFCHALQKSYSGHDVAIALKKHGVDVLKLDPKLATTKTVATPRATKKAAGKPALKTKASAAKVKARAAGKKGGRK